MIRFNLGDVVLISIFVAATCLSSPWWAIIVLLKAIEILLGQKARK